VTQADSFGVHDGFRQSLLLLAGHVTYNQLRLCLSFGCLPGILMAGVSEVTRGGMRIVLGEASCWG
jgi:hypothetical protein